jgi:hypothetical protein
LEPIASPTIPVPNTATFISYCLLTGYGFIQCILALFNIKLNAKNEHLFNVI